MLLRQFHKTNYFGLRDSKSGGRLSLAEVAGQLPPVEIRHYIRG
jgi:hypothetical protein